MVSTRLATDDAGAPVLVKEGDEALLAREADVLAAARHPGVVEVSSSAPGRLVLRWVGSRTLADLRPTVEDAAAIAAALAATVADLHALGIRHGRIAPGRVVIDGRGRPVLCGFADAALAGEPGPSPADDVAGVGTVVRALAGPDAELEPIPEERFVRRRSWPGALRRALLTVADQATDDDPARRPSARALAATLADLVPSTPPPAPRSRRRARALAGAEVLVVVAVGIASVAGGTSEPATRVPPTVDAGEPLRMVECPTVQEPAVDHDGDGCPSAVVLGPGTVAVDGTRYGVGQPGDLLAVGDWDCDGTGTVAAVRPATGEVFVFDGWAGPGADVEAPAVATVTGAAHALADDGDGDGCPTLVVVDGEGRRTEVVA
jgi:hypothetical protein